MTDFFIQIPNGYSLVTEIRNGVPCALFDAGRIFTPAAPPAADGMLTVRVEALADLFRPASNADILRAREQDFTPEDETVFPSPNVLVLAIEGSRKVRFAEKILLPAFPVVQ